MNDGDGDGDEEQHPGCPSRDDDVLLASRRPSGRARQSGACDYQRSATVTGNDVVRHSSDARYTTREAASGALGDDDERVIKTP